MNYKDTVFLPKTSMPTRAKVEIELPMVEKWSDLYESMRFQNTYGPEFHLHDGPPYANGDIHLGHAMNKILKDFAVRSRLMMGYRASFTPGWDCHGLPIEWKVEEEWRKRKRDKNLDPKAFRQDCRDYATKWVNRQREQFKRLGIVADWDHPYLTMEKDITTMMAFHQMVKVDSVFRDNRPTLWSPAEKTALSDAEIVEREHQVPNLWLKFPISSGPLVGSNLLVWTTTAWSLPGNVAVAFNPLIQYGLYRNGTEEFVIADSLATEVLNDSFTRVRNVDDSELIGHQYKHPLGDPYPCGEIIAADFVRASAGTGFVHVGPAHSVDDWNAWRNHKGNDAEYPNPVGPNGVFVDDVPLVANIAVTKGKKFGPANDMIVEHLLNTNMLYRAENRPLTIAHSWRSDAVLLTISTPQWFISLDHCRDRAAEALAEVNVTPYSAKVRMFNMLKTRPNWLVSRQRYWGTPLGLFVDQNGNPCRDPKVLKATREYLSQNGTEAWFDVSPKTIFELAQRDDFHEYSRVDDVLDVWFDSANVNRFLDSPQADLVIEGTDQARGWFGSSLWAACLDANAPVPPHRNIVTHGFILDKHGRKMSKSEGNVIDPTDVINQFGADTLRVWVASVDWLHDVKVSQESLKNCSELARKLRNTLRYFSGALGDYTEPTGRVVLPELEAYVLEKTYDLDRGHDSLTALLGEQKYTVYLNKLLDFCQFISSSWFDVRKDTLYCSSKSDETRVAYLWTMNRVFEYLVRWMAPILSFATEEAWGSLGKEKSVHLSGWLSVPQERNEALVDRWDSFEKVKSELMSVLEKARHDGVVKSNSEACVSILLGNQPESLPDDLEQLLMVSDVTVSYHNGDNQYIVSKTSLRKCERCWQYNTMTDLCGRCDEVIGDQC
jgi:isoleucyl-tRNA synthetase